MDNKIRIAIGDDMKFICDYFTMMLQNIPRFEIVGSAQTFEGILEIAEQEQPDVMLLDLNFNAIHSGIDHIPMLKDVNPNGKIIIITVHDQGNLILDAMTNGADNYLLKDIPVDELERAIVDTYENNKSFSNQLLRNVVDEANKIKRRQQSILLLVSNISSLSPRQFEVLQQLYLGKTYNEIADYLVIEKVTVRTYVSSILKKMGYSSSKALINDIAELEIFEYLSSLKNSEQE